jgi:Tfp pilus assembly protein PilO
MKNRQQLLVIAASAIVVLFVCDKLVLPPLIAAWNQRNTQIADLRKQVAHGKSLIQREDSIHRRWSEMRTNTLPVDTAVAEQQLLTAFDFWAQESRVSVLSITPQWKRDADDYLSLECRVEAFGNLSTITRFLYDIEKDSMALKLESVELAARDNEGQQLSLGLQISGLVLNPQAPNPQPAKE